MLISSGWRTSLSALNVCAAGRCSYWSVCAPTHSLLWWCISHFLEPPLYLVSSRACKGFSLLCRTARFLLKHAFNCAFTRPMFTTIDLCRFVWGCCTKAKSNQMWAPAELLAHIISGRSRNMYINCHLAVSQGCWLWYHDKLLLYHMWVFQCGLWCTLLVCSLVEKSEGMERKLDELQ